MSETLPALATRTPADLIAWGRTAIEKAASFIEAKEIRDQAEALRAYKRSVGAAQEAVDAAQEIRVRAERRMGQELNKLEKNKGSAGTGRPDLGGNKNVPPKSEPKLADIGVSKQQSSDWQQLAAVDDATFDAILATAKETGRLSLSAVKGLLRARRLEAEVAKPAARKGKHAKAKATRRHIPAWKPPTPEEEAQNRVTQLFHLTGRAAELIEHLGTPAEVVELSTKRLKDPGHRHFDPKKLYRIADFLTALAAEAEEHS